VLLFDTSQFIDVLLFGMSINLLNITNLVEQDPLHLVMSHLANLIKFKKLFKKKNEISGSFFFFFQLNFCSTTKPITSCFIIKNSVAIINLIIFSGLTYIYIYVCVCVF
jgi:ammonia channel protein AmtB